MSHGGSRAGAGRPKGAKNTATKKAKATIGELARAHAEGAIAALVSIASSGVSESARVAAANALLDRGYGKPSQAMEVTGKDGKDLMPEAKGVLVVPGVMDEAAWMAMMAARQGKAS